MSFTNVILGCVKFTYMLHQNYQQVASKLPRSASNLPTNLYLNLYLWNIYLITWGSNSQVPRIVSEVLCGEVIRSIIFRPLESKFSKLNLLGSYVEKVPVLVLNPPPSLNVRNFKKCNSCVREGPPRRVSPRPRKMENENHFPFGNFVIYPSRKNF